MGEEATGVEEDAARRAGSTSAASAVLGKTTESGNGTLHTGQNFSEETRFTCC